MQGLALRCWRFARIDWLRGFIRACSILCVALSICAPFSVNARPTQPTKRFKLVYFDELTPNTHKDIEILKSLLKTNHGLDESTINIVYSAVPKVEPALRDVEIAKQISALHADLVFATRAPDAASVKRALPKQPTLFVSSEDPVRAGLVGNFSRPGGLVSGITFGTDIWTKQLEILSDCFPDVRTVGLLVDNLRLNFDGNAQLNQTAESLNLSIHKIAIPSTASVRELLSVLSNTSVDAWLIPGTVPSVDHRAFVLSTLHSTNKPSIWDRKRAARMGADIVFDDSLEDWQSLVAKQISLILSGVPIGDLPVERPRGYTLFASTSGNMNRPKSKRCILRSDLR
jgi:putative tryptophan/tyrosine transport system substrate-binding protein